MTMILSKKKNEFKIKGNPKMCISIKLNYETFILIGWLCKCRRVVTTSNSHSFYFSFQLYIYTFVYVCVCVCQCVSINIVSHHQRLFGKSCRVSFKFQHKQSNFGYTYKEIENERERETETGETPSNQSHQCSTLALVCIHSILYMVTLATNKNI